MSAPADNRPTTRRGRRPATSASSTAGSSASSTAASSAPADNVVSLPGQAGPVPGELPVPGAGGYRYTPGSGTGAGVWKDRRRVLPWCPAVTRHLVTYSPRGEILARRVTIEVNGVTATVSTRDVADGSVWANRFPGAAGAAGREMRETLTNIVDDQAARLPLSPVNPLWSDGRLILPPADVLPAGYGETAGTREDFRAIVRTLVEAPRVALAVGLAVGGLYVAPLGRQSYVVHLSGRSSAGKTTTANAAAAVFGNPRNVVKRWDVTGNGLGAWLRDMACLTGFRDELGAAKFRASDLESVVFRATEGAQRDVSDRDGRLRETQGSWHGALISTGNESIVERVPNEGVAARVVEFGGAMTPSAAWADRLDGLTRAGYGHGLPAIIDRALSPAEFAEWAERAGVAVELPEGGPGRRVGQHIALGVAGARLLGELFDVPELAEVAEAAGRELLAELAAGLVERGSDPGERLLAAISGAMAARPAEFPTRSDYEKALAGVIPLPREITGWDLTGDGLGGDVAIIQSRLSSITEPAGIDDPGIALRELRKRGLLLAPADGRNLARLVKVAGKPRRVYVVGGVHTDEAEIGAGNDTPDGPVTTSVTTPVTASEQGGNDGNDISGDDTMTRAREAEPVQTALDVDGQAAEPAGPAAEVVTVAEASEPCERCGLPTPVRRGGRVLHLDPCPQPAQTVVAASADTTPADVTPAGPIGPQRAARPAEAVAEREGPSRDDEIAGALRALVNLHTEADGTVSREITAELAAGALDAWHAATGGLQWREWAGSTGIAAYYATRARDGAEARGIAGVHRLEHPIPQDWRDAVRLHPDHVDPAVVPQLGQHVTEVDVNAQFLSTSDIPLGTGEPVLIERPASVRALLTVPGYVQLAEDIDTDSPAWSGWLTAGAVLPMPTVQYLVKHRGINVRATAAYVWAQGNHRPHLAAWKRRMRVAWERLTELAAADDPEWSDRAALALKLLKHVCTVTLGGMLRSFDNPTDLMRRDWSDHIIAEAWTRALIAVDKARAAGHSPMGMRRDSAWFLADAAPFVPAGITVAPRLGKWKVSRYAAVDEAMIAAHEAGSAETLNRAIKAAHEARIAEVEGRS